MGAAIEKIFADMKIGDEIRPQKRREQKYVLAGTAGKNVVALLRAIASELEPTSGAITRSRGLRIGYVEQDVPATLHGLTLRDAVLDDDLLLQAASSVFDRLLKTFSKEVSPHASH